MGHETPDLDVQLALRVPSALRAEVEREARRMADATGLPVTPSDIMRLLLSEALEARAQKRRVM